MKYLLLILFIIILNSCDLSPIHVDMPMFGSINDAMTYETNNFRYISDPINYGVPDYWANPQQFIDHGGGDCEDWSIWLMYVIHTQFGGDPQLACTKNHAIVFYKNHYYESQKALILDSYDGINNFYDYSYVMSKAHH